MKKLIICFAIMATMTLSMCSVFARDSQYITVYDKYTVKVDNNNYATATLAGTHNTYTDRLSNVNSSKSECGTMVTVELDKIDRTQQTAKMWAYYYVNGSKHDSELLEIP